MPQNPKHPKPKFQFGVRPKKKPKVDPIAPRSKEDWERRTMCRLTNAAVRKLNEEHGFR